MRRGRETEEHVRLKRKVGEKLAEMGLLVEFEKLNADVVAVDPRSGRIIVVEIERSSRNTEANVARNFLNGSDVVILCASSKRIRKDLETAMRRLPDRSRNRTFVACIENLDAILSELLG